eukprot:7724396-Prorocentrum_lima.AAC.1
MSMGDKRKHPELWQARNMVDGTLPDVTGHHPEGTHSPSLQARPGWTDSQKGTSQGKSSSTH